MSDLTKRYETEQPSPKLDKIWVWGHKDGQKMAQMGPQTRKTSGFRPCAFPQKNYVFEHRDGPKPEKYRVLRKISELSTQNTNLRNPKLGKYRV